ncbi:carboxypeptidase-like regulatory domain-containing protein [Occallatibacter savannae]|uniref:carboxypeptidase-like regulatory domain-containing protein n=1 Tax=Occallatibacter savannae TaxID=1002691 RepID=UPI003B837FB8
MGTETTILVPTTLHGPLQVLDRDALAPSHIDVEIGHTKDVEIERFPSSIGTQSSAIRTSSLQGVIEDQTGAFIPNALIQVRAKGTGGRAHVVALISADRNGRFLGHLPDGEYLAFISAPGFTVRVTPFIVASTASAADVRFVLEVGSTN